MHELPRAAIVVLLAWAVAPSLAAQHPAEPHTLEPRQAYVVERTVGPVVIDGRTDEPAWRAAPWSADFVDIEGHARPRPPLRTRMRMLWDDEFLYIAAALEEPDVWATLTQRDAVIYRDDDFEVFIDPDGDTHAYYELEVNALGTAWDLLLTRPYRDGGRAIDAWDIRDLRVGVHVAGTLNQPGDRDEGWSVELAIPWAVLAEAAPEGRAPRAGEQWRMNFSRVDWDVAVRDGHYHKLDRPEHNWVWSPQGAVNMHMPERWGLVRFGPGAGVGADPDQAAVDALRALYYAQRRHHGAHGRYAADAVALGVELPPAVTPRIELTTSGYEITARGPSGRLLHIREDGRAWASGGSDR